MLWLPSRPARARLKPAGFIIPCQPYLADRPPAGPEWQHEIKWDGYRIIARKRRRSGAVVGAHFENVTTTDGTGSRRSDPATGYLLPV
jgi:ATP-dependent DNA ligase